MTPSSDTAPAASDIVERLHDLHKQATEERSHYYVGKCVRAAIAEIERLRALPSTAPSAWRSMDSAPRDGTRFLAWIDGGERHEIIGWMGDCWFNGDVTDFMFGEPTHWQPLPARPMRSRNE